MSREEEFEEFLMDASKFSGITNIENLAETEIDFLRGYFNAVKDLPAILVNARQMTHDRDYPILNNFIEQITRIMYDETLEGMDANLENYTRAVLENIEK